MEQLAVLLALCCLSVGLSALFSSKKIRIAVDYGPRLIGLAHTDFLGNTIPNKLKMSDHRRIEELLDSIQSSFLVEGSLKPPSQRIEPTLPPELIKVYERASEWHLIPDNYGVFGFNIHPFAPIENVFGDEEVRDEWRESHDHPNCAEDDYKCFATFSEFDNLFVNVNPESEDFGATRHIVNNCDDDRPVTAAPFSNFLILLESFASDYATAARNIIGEDDDEEGENDDEEEEENLPSFHDYLKMMMNDLILQFLYDKFKNNTS
jgi:hypothetical protein